jgi:hypothetical protein
VVRDQFYHERLYTADEIVASLEAAGLGAPRLQRALQVPFYVLSMMSFVVPTSA